jgi:hypothetical protein
MNYPLRLFFRRACVDSDAKCAEYEYRSVVVEVPITEEHMLEMMKYQGYEVIGGEWLKDPIKKEAGL